MKFKKDTIYTKIRDYVLIPLIFIGLIMGSIMPSVYWDKKSRQQTYIGKTK